MNLSIIKQRKQVVQTILDWSSTCPDIKALALVGSGARSDHPADEWSDIDLILITPDADRYLASSDWLNVIGDLWIATVERDPAGNIIERRALFRSGVDVDFIFLSPVRAQALQEEPLASIISRGIRVLLDKEGIFPPAPDGGYEVEAYHLPAAAEFSELVNDFWFHAVWTAKKIRRGELWTAKACCDQYMKRLLLTLIEWHAHMDTEAGHPVRTWYNGRFIECWASASILERLRGVFAYYDEADIWEALRCTMALFDTLALEIAVRFRYPYPDEEAKYITAYVKRLELYVLPGG